MKVNGEKLYVPFEKVIVIPRGTVEEHIAFKAKSVDCREEFEKLCPRPDPPEITKPGGTPQPDYKDPKYQEKIMDISRKYFDFMSINSLTLPEGWEWDNVDPLDPDTYCNWKTELTDAGFSESEVVKIGNDILTVNNLNPQAVEQAEKDFLALQARLASLQSDQTTEQISTPYGESVNDLD